MPISYLIRPLQYVNAILDIISEMIHSDKYEAKLNIFFERAMIAYLVEWEDIQETLYVSSNKTLAKSLLKGMKEKFKDCQTELDW